jgi:hypothetical protein
MLKRSHVGLTLTLAAALGLAACGSKSTGPSFSGTISDSAATSFGASAVSFVDDMLYTYQAGSPNIEISFSPATPVQGVALLNRAYQMAGVHRTFTIKGRPAGSPPIMKLDGSDCDPVVSGDSADADEDGIPNNEKETVDCTTVDSVSHDTTKTHIVVRIADVSGIYGFNISVSATLTTSGPDGRGQLALTESEGFSVTTTLDQDHVTVDVNETSTPTGGAASGGEAHYNWDSSFTPAEGEVLGAYSPPDGTLSFNGGFFVTSLDAPTTNFNFGIVTTTPLVYQEGCGSAPPFTGGTVSGHLKGATSDVGFTVTYTGCGDDPTIVGHGNVS